MHLLIDADACPVTSLALCAAQKHGVPVTLFCDCAHVFAAPGAEVVTVTRGADSADFALVNRAKAGDLVVTQDYGLAAMCLAKKARAVNQDGRIYTDENISGLLLSRHENRKLRMSGGRVKGPAKRTQAQDKAFLQTLNAILEEQYEA